MPKRVIMADDSTNFREAIAEYIEVITTDVEVEGVPDGESLVERVKGGGYSLVLTEYDVGYGGMNGIDVISAIREFDTEVPCYMLSVSREVRVEALKAGATGYVYKGSRTMMSDIKAIVLKHLG